MIREATQESHRTLRCHRHRLEEQILQVRTRGPCELAVWHRHHHPKSCLDRCSLHPLLRPQRTNRRCEMLPTSTPASSRPSKQKLEHRQAVKWIRLDQLQRLLPLRLGLRKCCNLPSAPVRQGQPKFQLELRSELSCEESRQCGSP